MSTLLQPLEGEDLKAVQNMAEAAFLDGECYAFGIAMSRDLSWKMLGLMEGPQIRHVAVTTVVPSNELWDVRGRFTFDSPKFGEPFGHRPPYTLKSVTEEQLRAVRPVPETTIVSASRIAQTMWLDLPWKNGSAEKLKAFLDELEALSRKHNVWLRAAYPGARPIINFGHGDEAGYTAEPTANMGGYLIDRRLK